MKIMVSRRKPNFLRDPRNLSYGILNVFGVSYGTPAALRGDAEASPTTLEPTRTQTEVARVSENIWFPSGNQYFHSVSVSVLDNRVNSQLLPLLDAQRPGPPLSPRLRVVRTEGLSDFGCRLRLVGVVCGGGQELGAVLV